MEVNKYLLNNLIDILLLKTKVNKDYYDKADTVSYDRKSIENVTYKKERLSNCYKITTNLGEFVYIYYVFIDKISGLSNLEFNDNVFPEPILLTSKAISKDDKTPKLNIFTDKELSFNYVSNIGNNVFILMDKAKMNGITFSMKKTTKTLFKKDIDDEKEIKIFYHKDKIDDIYGVIYKSHNGSIGVNFNFRFYKNIRT